MKKREGRVRCGKNFAARSAKPPACGSPEAAPDRRPTSDVSTTIATATAQEEGLCGRSKCAVHDNLVEENDPL